MFWSLKSVLFVLLVLFIPATAPCFATECVPEAASLAVADQPGTSQDTGDDPVKKPQEDPKKKDEETKKGKLERLKKGDKNSGGKKPRLVKPKTSDPATRKQRQATRAKQEPKVVEDIVAFRQEPATMTTKLEERFKLDLSDVNYDAPIIATINGEKITREMFRMNVVDSVGALEVDRFTTALLTEIIKEKLIAEGADPSLFDVPDKMVEDDIQTQVMMAKQQDRTGKFDEETWKSQIASTFGWDRFVAMTRSNLAFGVAYLPEIEPAPEETLKEDDPVSTGEAFAKPGEEVEVPIDPSLPVDKDFQGKEVNIHMPLHTWKMLDRSDQDRNLRDIINKAYRMKSPLGGFMRPHYIRMVQEAVVAKTEIIYHTSGKLPEGVYMSVGGKNILLDEIYSIVTGRFRPEDRELVLKEMLVYKAMDRDLKAKGYYPTEEDFEAAFTEHEKTYEGSLFPLRFIMRINGYLSKENYRKMYLRRHGFESMLKGEGKFTDECLQGFFQKSGRLFYQNGGVKVQLIFIGAFDHKERKMREDGFAYAKSEMDKALKELAEPGADFLTVAKKYENPKGTYTTCDFDYLSRNDLRSTFDEKTKTILSEGYSLADDIFYNKKDGDIVGPLMVMRGDFGVPVFKGAYLAKVVSYRTMQDLRPFEDSRPMVEMDYVDLGFLRWSSKVLADSEIVLSRNS